jgi:hypothetical protein
VPDQFATLGLRFVDDPGATLRAIGWHGYLFYIGDTLVLLPAMVAVAAYALTPAGRRDRRVLLLGAATVVVALATFAMGRPGGITDGNLLDAVSALRYLATVPILAAATLAFAGRRSAWLRWTVAAVLGAAVAVDIDEIRKFVAGLAPSPWIALLVVVAGGLAGWLAGRAPGFTTVIKVPILAGVLTLGACLLVAVPARHYLANYERFTTTPAPFDESPVLRFLNRQPGWAHGHAPVTAVYAAMATYAGPDFTHPLTYLPVDAGCGRLRAAARAGWLVLWALPAAAGDQPSFSLWSGCFTDITPVGTAGGVARIYAPPSLLSAARR